MKKARVGAALFLLLSVASITPASAGFFNSRFDDFKELVQAGQTENAAALYAEAHRPVQTRPQATPNATPDSRR